MRVFLVVTKPLAGLTNSDVAFGNLFEKNQAKLYRQELVAGLATGSMKTSDSAANCRNFSTSSLQCAVKPGFLHLAHRIAQTELLRIDCRHGIAFRAED